MSFFEKTKFTTTVFRNTFIFEIMKVSIIILYKPASRELSKKKHYTDVYDAWRLFRKRCVKYGKISTNNGNDSLSLRLFRLLNCDISLGWLGADATRTASRPWMWRRIELSGGKSIVIVCKTINLSPSSLPFARSVNACIRASFSYREKQRLKNWVENDCHYYQRRNNANHHHHHHCASSFHKTCVFVFAVVVGWCYTSFVARSIHTSFCQFLCGASVVCLVGLLPSILTGWFACLPAGWLAGWLAG